MNGKWKNIVQFGSIVFTEAKIIFLNTKSKKGVISVKGTCSGREMMPIRVMAKIIGKDRLCVNCEKEIVWFISDARVEIINYIPSSNELVVRVRIECECKTIKEIILLLSLAR